MASAPHYSDVSLQYGAGASYRGIWLAPTSTTGAESVHFGAVLKLYTAGGLKIAEFSSDATRSGLEKLTFELLPTGPGKIEFTVTDLPPGISITHEMRVDVHLQGRRKPIYSGFIQYVPNTGTTEWPPVYRGFGYFSALDRVMLDGTYTSIMVWRLVDTIVQYLSGRTNVVYSASQIVQDSRTLYALQEIVFLKTPFKTAMDQLANLAGGYVYGVDAQRQFWFQPPNLNVTDESRLWVGKNLSTYVSSADSTNIKNRLWVKQGQVSTSGDNYLSDPIEDLASQGAYGIRESTYTAPNVFNESDAYRAAAVELAKSKDPTQLATVSGIDLQGTPITCDGYVRLYDVNGNGTNFPKAKVTYKIDGKGITVDLQLGDLLPTPGLLVADVAHDQAVQELLQQISQQQISLA